MNELEEISFYELFIMMSKGWKTILITTFIAFVFSIGLYIFFNQPTFELQTKSSISFNQNQYTDLGEYTYPYTKSEDFIKLLKDEDYIAFLTTKTNLEKSVILNSISYTVKDFNNFVIKVSNSNIETVNIILKVLKENNENYLNYYLSKEALVNLSLSKSLRLKSLNKNLIDVNKIISYLESKLDETRLYLGSNINPEYSSLLNVLEVRKTIRKELEYSISDIEESIKIIDAFNNQTLTFQDYIGLDSKLLISELELKYDEEQSQDIFRFNAKVLFPIACLFGIMLGIFIVIFERYWTSSSQKKFNKQIY